MNSEETIRRVINVVHLRPNAFLVRVERHGFEFIPGQHVTLGLAGEGINREYSIYSGGDDDFLEFLVKIHPGSDSAEILGKAREGDEVVLAGPYGAIHLPEGMDRGTPVWFIAAGVGIAPFHSIARSCANWLDYRVLHGVSQAADAYGRADFDPSRHILCCSQVANGGFHGRVTDWLRENSIAPEASVFICGAANMVAETYDCLRSRGHPSDHLFTEVFF